MQAVNLTKLLKNTAIKNRARLAAALGIKPQAVYQWTCVPPSQLPTVSRLTGIPMDKLNPAYAKELRGAA